MAPNSCVFSGHVSAVSLTLCNLPTGQQLEAMPFREVEGDPLSVLSLLFCGT